MRSILQFVALAALLLPSSALADVLVPLKSSWKFVKGTEAPSSPASAWRSAAFDDSRWGAGPAPFYYGENLGAGTVLSDMRNNYTTFYLRKSFMVSDPEEIDRIALRIQIDDGYVVWVNGTEIARFNVPDGDLAHNAVARGAIELQWVTNSITSPSRFLVAGENWIAVQVLNNSRTSSDIVFDLQMESTSDRMPPVISAFDPAPGKVADLRGVTVQFSEAVQGIKAEDFLINNTPSAEVAGTGDRYTFTFQQPEFGTIDISWDAGHQITDFADPPHPFDANGEGATARYELRDEIAPYIIGVLPPTGLAIRALNQVEVRFSEPVRNVDAADLLAGGRAATNVTQRGEDTYLFHFEAASPGVVDITWAAEHNITDLAAPANLFSDESWSYVVDPELPIAQVVISEFLASAENATNLKDENGELQDWIEIHNTGSASVNLAGWSLTDDSDEPGLWIFPNVSIAAGARLVIFASGKDRRSGPNLHTSFKLGTGGEYLALFNADSPRLPMTEFRNDYPEQRTDYSYGVDSNGQWRYFQRPTPGQPNGSSSITGIVPRPEISHERGWHDQPFILSLGIDFPGTTIRYTTDGSIPTESNGSIYNTPFTVSSNLVLRAAAFRAGHLPSATVTHTFLFVDHVIRQPNNPNGFPVGPTVMGGYPSDYEMDPQVVDDPAYSGEIRDALKALPILSISLKNEDMFGLDNGIYIFPLRRGPAWERICSVEFMPLDGRGFQVDAGIQVQGNAAREPIKNPKHPFRVTFKGDYGPKKLDYRMFPDSPVSSFNTLVLRADFNYSWLHWNPTQRIRAQRTRDAWMKDTMREMGGLASRNRYVHLFINGLYWGVYDPTERPDGSYGEAYLGGDKEDYDVINEGQVVDGTATAYNTLLSFPSVSTFQQYNTIQQYLDMPQFIDYMLLHFFVGHEDWGNNKNWYTIRPRDGSRGFLYMPWDGEMVLGDPNVNRVNSSDVPSGLHTKLLSNEQYRMDFADRVHRHLFNEGVLTGGRNIARWMNRAREIELPIIAESARWGDYRRDVHQYQSPPYEFYTRDNQWRAEQNRLVNVYFPGRTSTVLNQLRNAGLYPPVTAPSFSQQGGKVEPGFALQITVPSGTIYYTTNGVDPRVAGTGAVAPQASIFSGPVTITSATQVKARAYVGGTWSALNEAVFTTESPRVPLRITELMYHPIPPGEAFEYIELQNFGALPFDASGYYLTGVNYVFPPQSIIAPGQIILLGSAENPASFEQRYPGVSVHGRFTGQLVNRGERVALMSPGGRIAQSVDYSDDRGWPEGADGDGYSLEMIDPFGDPDDPSNWQESAARDGSPGRPNSPVVPASVIISEALARSSSGPDWLELYNPGENPVDLGGWTLQDTRNSSVFVFPSATVLGPGGYLVVQCGGEPAGNTFHAPFALGVNGETVVLRDFGGKIRNVFRFGPQVTDLSAGWVDGAIVLTEPTPGAPNRAAGLADPAGLIINEWLADSVSGGSDWLELYNPGPLPVSLKGLFLATSEQIFEITSVSFVAAGGFVSLLANEGSGANHLDFKLPAAGTTLQLLDSAGTEISTVTYGPQIEGISEGRYPDGTDNIVAFTISPSPGAPNSLSFPITYALSASQVEIGWASSPEKRYRVEWSEDLAAWNVLREIVAESATCAAQDALNFRQRYYRVVALP